MIGVTGKAALLIDIVGQASGTITGRLHRRSIIRDYDIAHPVQCGIILFERLGKFSRSAAFKMIAYSFGRTPPNATAFQYRDCIIISRWIGGGWT